MDVNLGALRFPWGRFFNQFYLSDKDNLDTINKLITMMIVIIVVAMIIRIRVTIAIRILFISVTLLC